MTQQGVEWVNQGYEAFAAGDTEAVRALLYADVTIEVRTDRADIGSDVYHGRQGFFENFAELTDVFDDLEIDPREDRAER
jgi:ketosteroid isomerase-like protein